MHFLHKWASIQIFRHTLTHRRAQKCCKLFFCNTEQEGGGSRHSATMYFCRILLWVLRPRWVCWLAAPEELVGRDSWAKLLKYGQEFPLSLPSRQLAPLCAIMEIKCTEARNEGGRREVEEGRTRLGRKDVRTSDLWSSGSLRLLNRKITRLRNCWSFYEKLRDLGQY